MTLKTIIYIIIFLAFVIFHAIYRLKPYIAIYLIIKDLITNKDLIKNYQGYGFWLFCGLGGSGKSISMVEYAYRQHLRYPKLWIVSGLKSLSFANEYIDNWNDIVECENPNGVENGVLILLDEIHLTLSSDKWKNAPDNLLAYVSQQRKFHKHILSTSQVYERVNIKLREQTNYIIECVNLGNRWFFNKAFHTMDYAVNRDLKDNGMKKRTRAWRYNFIGTDQVRSLYDTYEIQIELDKQNKNIIDVERLVQLINDK